MLEINRATIGQLDALASLFNAYRVFYGRKPDLDGARAFLEARLQHEESVIFLAELDSQPAGFTQLYPLFSSVNMSRIWLLNDLYVAESARRHGVADALLDAARKHGEQTGASGLMLETAEDNRPAQTLYERKGWKREDGFYWYALEL
ncbi:MAG: GNAT family N-acetyltransferase [Gammaproteobacteria bacterium]